MLWLSNRDRLLAMSFSRIVQCAAISALLLAGVLALFFVLASLPTPSMVIAPNGF